MDAEKCTITFKVILDAKELSLPFLVNHSSSGLSVLIIQYLLPLSRSQGF